MMRDPEELREKPREPRRVRAPASGRDELDGVEVRSTRARLESLRAGDEMAQPRRLLAYVRGDRRPFDLASLQRAIADVANDQDLPVDKVRAALDRALRAEGSSLAQCERTLSAREAARKKQEAAK